MGGAATPFMGVELQRSDSVKAHKGVTNTKHGGELQIQIRILKVIIKIEL